MACKSIASFEKVVREWHFLILKQNLNDTGGSNILYLKKIIMIQLTKYTCCHKFISITIHSTSCKKISPESCERYMI